MTRSGLASSVDWVAHPMLSFPLSAFESRQTASIVTAWKRLDRKCWQFNVGQAKDNLQLRHRTLAGRG